MCKRTYLAGRVLHAGGLVDLGPHGRKGPLFKRLHGRGRIEKTTGRFYCHHYCHYVVTTIVTTPCGFFEAKVERPGTQEIPQEASTRLAVHGG